MIALGYMYKSISKKPDWLKSDLVKDIYSLSGCISNDFTDWINFWQHNGYWLFNSPEIIEKLCRANHISLENTTLLYYESFDKQWDDDGNKWSPIEADKSFGVDVKIPEFKTLIGYDIVSYSCQNAAECSPLSCNGLAAEINVNEHCLIHTMDEAKHLLESGIFADCEPGPYRIIEVNRV